MAEEPHGAPSIRNDEWRAALVCAEPMRAALGSIFFSASSDLCSKNNNNTVQNNTTQGPLR
jgi:hypothetical protein